MLPPAYSPITGKLAGVLPPAYGVGAPSSGLLPAYGVYPELDLDFTRPSGGLNSLITFSRASSATYFDSTGTLQTAASGVARANAYQDYNPSTLAPLGFLIEEQRINSIRNNTMVGASAGTPGTMPTNWSTFTALTGITRQVVGTGTESGIAYIDIKLSGTPSGAGSYSFIFEGNAQVAALNAQVWTHYAYMKLASGSLTGISSTAVSITENNNVGGFLASSSTTYTPTSAGLATQRDTHTRTLNNALTAYVQPTVVLGLTGVAIDITLRIGLPQLEQGSFATSPILTTTAAATRLADSVSITGASFSSFWNASEGTILVKGVLEGGTSGSFPYQVSAVGASADSDAIGINWAASNGAMRGGIRASGSGSMDQFAGAAKSAGNSFKAAIAYKANDGNFAVDGSVGTTDTTVTLPTCTALRIGGPTGFQPTASTWIQQVQYFRIRFPNATMQAITT